MRSVLAVIAGVIAGFILVVIIEGTGQKLYPSPDGLDPTNPESIRLYMSAIPLGAKLFIVGAWCVGVAAGTTIAVAIMDGGRVAAAIVFGFFFAAIVVNLAMIPHPLWMAVAGVLGSAASAFIATQTMRRALASRVSES